MRRGILHDTAKKYGCNKIALGHHLDDAAETFMMNLLNGGTIKCFSPVSFLSRKELYLIRPLIFAYEKDVKRAAASLDLPIVKSKCPADGVTERQSTKSCSRLSKGNTRHSEKNRGCTAKRRNKRLVTKSKCEKVLYLPYYNDIILLI